MTGASMLVFAATIFLSAFLLFQIQPLIAKVILPWFGGAPNVWTTCMLFFQVVLLGGYLYAHLLNRLVYARLQWVLHGIILAVSLLVLRIVPGDEWKPSGATSSVPHILAILAMTIGLPYFVLSTTGPLIQAAFARKYVGRSPYRLFALSNLGSLLALLSFPFVFEPLIGTSNHAWVWSVGYWIFAALCLAALLMSRAPAAGFGDPAQTAGSTTTLPSPDHAFTAPRRHHAVAEVIWWLALSLVPSVMLLATTNHLSQRVAVLPFLWIAPLALYLVSFIICFEKPAWYRRDIWGIAMVVGMTLTVLGPHIHRGAIVLRVASYLFAMFAAAMVCHGELAFLRPEARRLTFYYLMISLGGALGGVFVVVAAPLWFDNFHELQLGFIAATVLFGWRLVTSGESRSIFRVAVVGSWLLMFVCLVLVQTQPEYVKKSDLERWTLVFAMSFAAGTALIHRRGELLPLVGRDAVWGTATLTRSLVGVLFLLWLVLSIGLIAFPEITVDFGMIAVMAWIALLAVTALLCDGRLEFLWRWAPQIGTAFVVGAAVLGVNYWAQQMLFKDPAMIYRSRDFYGVMSILEEKSDFEGDLRTMLNGQIVHGFQYIKIPENRLRRTTYFGSLSGVGIALDHHPRRARDSFKVGVIGLGTGSVAVYARPGDEWVFYEIKPDCDRVARDYFYYLSDNPAADRTRVEIGDARILLERKQESEQFDILIVDAFSGDSPPRHLMTRESFEVYRRHTKPDGIIAFNITNGYFAFNRVVLALAQDAGWRAEWFNYRPTGVGADRYLYESIWALVSANEEFMNLPIVRQHRLPWDHVRPVMWTDDFGGLWQILIFHRPSWLPAGWFASKPRSETTK